MVCYLLGRRPVWRAAGPLGSRKEVRRLDLYQPIENYGLIGDLFTVALVGMDGSIDFMCFPEFDSPTVFARMLDSKKGGFFRLAQPTRRMKDDECDLGVGNDALRKPE